MTFLQKLAQLTSYIGARRVSAGGIVVRPDGRILLVEQHQNSWSFPKGGVERGESYLEASVREIAEETGLTDVVYVRDLGSYVRRSIGLDGTSEAMYWPPTKRVFFLFTTKGDSHQASHDGEVTEVRWVTVSEAIELLTHPKDKAFLQKVSEAGMLQVG